MSEMKRRDFLKTAAVAGIGALAAPMIGSAFAQAPARKPNVLIIYTDDHPKSLFGCYGGQKTPHIDKIAEEGVRFERFYVSTGLCAPSRYGLQNARFASASASNQRLFPAGTMSNMSQQLGDEHNRPPKAFTLPTCMRTAGYKTGIVGKYHQGFMGERMISPTKHGIMDLPIDDPKVVEVLKHNFTLAQESAHAGGYDYAEALYHDNIQPDNFPKCAQFHNMEWITWKACQFMEANKDKPFLLVVNPTLVHWRQANDPDYNSLKADRRITGVGLVEGIPEDIQPSRESVLKRAEEMGAADNPKSFGPDAIWLDDAVGALTKKVADLGLDDHTIVMVISDNGTSGKWSCAEGGVNTGAVMRWKGKIPAGIVSEALVQNVDIAPTLFEIAGAKLAPEFKIHGVSQADVLLGKKEKIRDSVYVEIGYQKAVVRDDGIKYVTVRYPEEIMKDIRENETIYNLSGVKQKKGSNPPFDALYDLKKAGESKNFADAPAYAEALKEMKVLMTRYCKALPHSYAEFTA
jgi:arylsulfatase A-like enzyme